MPPNVSGVHEITTPQSGKEERKLKSVDKPALQAVYSRRSSAESKLYAS